MPDHHEARMSIADSVPVSEPIADGNSHSNGHAYGFTDANAVPIAHDGLLFACGHE